MTEPMPEVPAPMPQGRAVTGPAIFVEGRETGDGRLAEPGATVWEDLPFPLPLSWARTYEGEHMGSIVVGGITEITRAGEFLPWRGFLLPEFENMPELVGLIESGCVGVSADLDAVVVETDILAVDDQGEPSDYLDRFLEARVRGATIVSIPAFAECTIAFEGSPMLAAVGESPAEPVMDDLPLLEPEVAPPALTAPPTVAGLALVAQDTGRILLIQRALDDADPAGGMWEIPGGHIEDGEASLDAALREFSEEVGVTVEAPWIIGAWPSGAVYQGYAALVPSEDLVPINPDTREVLNPDDPDSDNVEVACWWVLEHIRDNPGLRPEMNGTPWDIFEPYSQPGPVVEPALEPDPLPLLAAAPIKPPASWFADPQFGDPEVDARLVRQRDGSYGCPAMLDDDGRIYGHLATDGACHRAYPGTCLNPPDQADFDDFLLGSTECDDGQVLATGTLMFATSHPDTPDSLAKSFSDTMRTYADTGRVAARINVGRDAYGTWFAGALMPDITDADAARLRAVGQVSGDWRWPDEPTPETTDVRLAAVLVVPTPGFRMTRVRTEAGQRTALVAAGPAPAPAPSDAERLDAVLASLAGITGRLDGQDELLAPLRAEALRARLRLTSPTV